jgi:hypothetical protein
VLAGECESGDEKCEVGHGRMVDPGVDSRVKRWL